MTMLSRRILGDITWIDLESPTQGEVRLLMDEFGVDAPVAEELLLPTVRPRFEMHERFLYIIFHFPALRHTHRDTEQEIDFVIGKNFVITTRYDNIDPLHKFAKLFEINSLIDEKVENIHGGHIFYYMMKKMYKSVEHEISSVRDELHDIVARIFRGKERQMVVALSRSARDLLDLRQVIEPHRDVLREIEDHAPGFFGEGFKLYMNNLSNEYYRVHNHIMREIESLHELRETNNSLLYTKQNEVMKILTLMAFVTFPLSLVAAVFGMNTVNTPIVGTPNDFWIIVGFMIVGMIFMFWYFKHKKWL